MTASTEQLSVDQLDDADNRSPDWESMRSQLKTSGTLPRGTYDATLREIALVKRKDTGAWVLRLLARTDRLGRYVVSWRGLSENPADPYDLTDGQVKGLRKFADSLGIPTPAPAEEIIEGLRVMLGQSVTARVVHTPVGQQATLSRGESTITIAPRPATDLEGKAKLAHVAHEKVIEGLQAARLGLACAAEGCHALHASEGWTALGFESLSEYLACPEVTLSRSEFYRLVSIWDRYVLNGGLQPMLLQGAGPSKLEVPLPALEAGVVDAAQAVADATTMTRKDLRTHYAALLADGEDGGDQAVRDEAASRRREDDGATVPVTLARMLTKALRAMLTADQDTLSDAVEMASDVLRLAREHGLTDFEPDSDDTAVIPGQTSLYDDERIERAA